MRYWRISIGRIMCMYPPNLGQFRRIPILAVAGLGVLGFPASTTGEQSASSPQTDAETSVREVLTTEQSKRVNESIDRALGWLATQQRADGSFATLDTGQPGVTSLCILAFMARGHLPGEGRYGEALNRAIEYALRNQQGDGVFSRIAPVMPTEPLNASYTSNYNHAITGLMLSEAYGMTRGELNRRIRPAIEKAIQYASHRLPQAKRRRVDPSEVGGWRYRTYRHRDDADLSVTSWHMLFLRSCKNAGFEVPQHLIDEALVYIGRLHQHQSGAFNYAFDNKFTTRAMTGAGILSFSLGGKHGDERSVRAGDYLLKHPFTRYNVGEDFHEHYFYSCFYASQGMFQLGGKYWREFYPPLARTLVANQRRDGSWDRDCHDYDQQFGQTYSTAMAVLALSPPYQSLPIFQR